MRIACIGTRDLTPEQVEIVVGLGRQIVSSGHIIRTGNAPGADQAYARGGNAVDPTKVELELPWPKFEHQAIVPGNVVKSLEDHSAEAWHFYQELGWTHHPAWIRLSQGARKLMIRNSAIMFFENEELIHSIPPIAPVGLCLAWPSNRMGGGGTGQGMRIAEANRIPVVNLSQMSPNELAGVLAGLQVG